MPSRMLLVSIWVPPTPVLGPPGALAMVFLCTGIVCIRIISTLIRRPTNRLQDMRSN